MVVAAILAAGSGQRFGSDKVGVMLGGKPLWRWSYDTFKAHPGIDRVILIGSSANIEALAAVGEAHLGGSTRQASSQIAAEACHRDDLILVHDGARPFVSAEIIDRVLQALSHSTAVAVAVPVTDTIKLTVGTEVFTPVREHLVAMQTPQAARAGLLQDAYRAAEKQFTDEMALLEVDGIMPTFVHGDESNFKVTRPVDLLRAQLYLGQLGGEIRTGIGYDIHPFSKDSSRKLWLGGVQFDDHQALDGHSDADVLLHAVTDALLGAASMGDIGLHFPNTDERWAGEPSLTFLGAAKELLATKGWQIVNVDATVIAETPKVMKRSDDIRNAIAQSLSLECDRVSIKATTNERLGSLGRSEGIAAFAVATIRR